MDSPPATWRLRFRVGMPEDGHVLAASGGAAAAYAIIVWMCHVTFGQASGGVGAVWMPAGVAYFAVMLFGVGIWPGIVIGDLSYNLGLFCMQDKDIPSELLSWEGLIIAIVAASVKATHITIGTSLFKIISQRQVSVEGVETPLDRVKDCSIFTLIVGGVTSVSYAIMTVGLALTGSVSWPDSQRMWLEATLADVTGILSVLPLLVQLRHTYPILEALRGQSPAQIAEFLAMLGCHVAFCGPITSSVAHYKEFNMFLPYCVIPTLLWAAFRFNRRGLSLLVLVSVLMVSFGGTQTPDPLQAQLLLAVVAILGLILGASIRDSRRLQSWRADVNDTLEKEVMRRTCELTLTNQELRASKKAAEEASRAKSEFLANMSHEIRTPIHGIMGINGIAQDSLDSLLSELSTKYDDPGHLTAELADHLETVAQSADCLLHIVNAVLDLAKIEAGKLELEVVPFRIRDTVGSTMKMLQVRAAQKQLVLNWEVASGVPEGLLGDPNRLQQCILNLVGNAIKFTQKGSVRVTVSLHDPSSDKNLSKDSEWEEKSTKDNGWDENIAGLEDNTKSSASLTMEEEMNEEEYLHLDTASDELRHNELFANVSRYSTQSFGSCDDDFSVAELPRMGKAGKKPTLERTLSQEMRDFEFDFDFNGEEETREGGGEVIVQDVGNSLDKTGEDFKAPLDLWSQFESPQYSQKAAGLQQGGDGEKGEEAEVDRMSREREMNMSSQKSKYDSHNDKENVIGNTEDYRGGKGEEGHTWGNKRRESTYPNQNGMAIDFSLHGWGEKKYLSEPVKKKSGKFKSAEFSLPNGSTAKGKRRSAEELANLWSSFTPGGGTGGKITGVDILTNGRVEKFEEEEKMNEGEEVWLLFTVQDTGIGIRKEQQKEVFKNFVQADTSTTRIYGGTGLGLSIVQRLVAMMEGRIWIESEVGHGSTFSFIAKCKTARLPPKLENQHSIRSPRELRSASPISDPLSKALPSSPKNESSVLSPSSNVPKLVTAVTKVLIPPSRPPLPTHSIPKQGVVPDIFKKPGLPPLGKPATGLDRPNREVLFSPIPETEKKKVPHSLYRMDTCPDLAAMARQGLLGEIIGDLEQGADSPKSPSSKPDEMGEKEGRAGGEAKGKSPLKTPTATSNEGGGERPNGGILESLSGLKILLAEDNVVNQKVARHVLTKQGVVVDVVGDGQMAVEKMSTRVKDYDCILMDIQMPVMDGLEATRLIRTMESDEGRKYTPIIGLTAHAIQGYKDQCLLAGMDGYACKPFRIDDLTQVILTSLAQCGKAASK